VSEELITEILANYLRMFYPDVIYHIDFGSGTKLTKGQAIKQAKLNRRGYPDLFIAEPRNGYQGMFLELKKDGVRLVKRDGVTWASEHIREQAQMLEALGERGYWTDFAVGYDNAVELIQEYLGLTSSASDDVF
jgi:hypothetical protein